MSAAWYDEALDLLAANAGRPHFGALGWLVFRGHRAHVLIPCDAGGPLGVIRRWNDASVAEHEAAMLERLQREEVAPALTTFPKPVGSFRKGESLISVQSWLAGSPMQARSGPKGQTAAVGYLSAFRRWLSLRLANRPLAPLLPSYATDVLARRLARRTPDGPAHWALQRFLAALDETLRAEHGILHNDLNLGNLLLDSSGRISGVLDWEHAGPGPLLCDWVGFVNQLALALSVGDRRALPTVQNALQAAWLEPGWLKRAVHAETKLFLASSQASSRTMAACWQLATFRVAYASIRDESPAAQATISEWLTLRAPDFSRD
jgi:hypothetical protein